MSLKASVRNKNKRRNGEPWVSNNRVLNSNACKKNGSFSRNPNFDTDETKLLIQLWGDPKVQRTLITTHKKHAVICQLATRMRDYGYYRSPEEITTRIKNMKCFYNRLKKDMEAGTTSLTEPTWKHFAEMDAIMTRPIFSVRPNEVPAPSLKYQLEKAREERQERKKKLVEEGGSLSDSDDEHYDDILASDKSNNDKHEIDDGIIPDVEVDIDINDETFAAITNAATEKCAAVAKRRRRMRLRDSFCEASDFEGEPEADESDSVDKDLHIKEENDSLEGIDEEHLDEAALEREQPPSRRTSKSSSNCMLPEKLSTPLMTPKEEPIDVDADEEFAVTSKETENVASVKVMMPTLVDMLQMSKTTAGGLMLPASAVATSTSTVVCSAAASTPTSSITTTPTAGKISLVPTNFLLQPKPPGTPVLTTRVAVSATTTPHTQTQSQPQQQKQQIHLLPNNLNATRASPRLLLSGPQAGTATATNAGIVTTGPGGMKVLLVNADQAAAAANQLCGNAGLAQQLSAAAANCQLGKTIGTVLPLNSTATSLFQQQQQQQQQQQTQQQLQQLQQQLQQQQQQLQQQTHSKAALQQEKHQQQQQRKKQLLEREKYRREELLLNRRDATGMRILLRQLLNAQNENNATQQKRLKLERERLDFEKSIAERFLTALPTFLNQQQQLMQQQVQQHQQQMQQQQKQLFLQQAQQQHLTVPTMSQLRLNPPKLLFATAAVPSSVAGATTLGAATLVTSTTPTVALSHTPATPTNALPQFTVVPATVKPVDVSDVQLVTPKVEKED